MTSYFLHPFYLIAIGYLFSSIATAASGSVSTSFEVQVQNQAPISISFNEIPRADQAVLSALHYTRQDMATVNWSNSALYNLSRTNTPKVTKRILLTIAHQQSLTSDPLIKKRWEILKNQLNSMYFAKREFTPLDPDITRTAAELNPKLEGKWLLILNTESNDVTVMGNVENPVSSEWFPRRDVNFYLEDAKPDTKKLSNVWVIQPNGDVERHDATYWKGQHKNIAPGAIIYVPFLLESTAFNSNDKQQDTNQLVIELLRNKLPL